MSEMPNYSVYHLHELESALREIDEKTHPEEAKIIREYIAKSGYTYPAEARVANVAFTSAGYKWSLVAILCLLLFLNLAGLIRHGALIALIPITVQGGILTAIFTKYKHTRALIKIWSGVLIIGALFHFISIAYAPFINISMLIDPTLTLLLGTFFLFLADRSVALVPVAERNAD